MMGVKLNSIELKGFKSIDSDGQTIPINEDITVMIGANGSGKSNVISFFHLLNHALTGSLQIYIARNGGADTFLHYGSKETESYSAKLLFSDGETTNGYSFRLSYAAGDKLIFTKEEVFFHKKGKAQPFRHTFEPGNKESQLLETQEGPQVDTVNILCYLLRNCRYYQFHDTTIESKIRRGCYINDYKSLKSNGGNLAAFLYHLKETDVEYYDRIVLYIKQVLRQFGGFELKPSVDNKNYVTLDWKEEGNDTVFGVHQLSDGTLRFIALATLLLQPPHYMPSLIVIDEPELGLHPKAISILANMVGIASEYAQVIIATQSPQLLDEFEERNIVVVEWDRWKHSSMFKQLDREQLKAWREEYSLSELWDKNVLGGRP